MNAYDETAPFTPEQYEYLLAKINAQMVARIQREAVEAFYAVVTKKLERMGRQAPALTVLDDEMARIREAKDGR